MPTDDFEFPDEIEAKKKAKGSADDEGEEALEIEIVDDTPPKDRNRKPLDDAPEEVTDSELESYSEKVRTRIQKFSKGYHDERRAKESALREKDEALKLAQAIIEENNKLKGTVNQNQQTLLEQAKRVVSQELNEAKQKIKAAYESGDSDAMVAAQEELAAVKYKSERVANFKPTPLQETETPVSIAHSPTIDDKAARWQAENKWFGPDDEMTSFALAVHNKLVKQGIDPKSDEYYEKINSRMRQVFPESFDDGDAESEKPRRKTSIVAPATRSTAPKKIVLTQTQVAIAKKLGVPLELYARKVAEEMRK